MKIYTQKSKLFATRRSFLRHTAMVLSVWGVTALLPSCGLVHSSDNGDLDGFWHLIQVDSIASAERKSVPYREEQVYWSFQGKLMQTQQLIRPNEIQYIYRFEREGACLTVKEPYRYDRLEGDHKIPADSLHLLRPFGINALSTDFNIRKLKKNKMILNDDLLELHFEKY